MIFKLFSYILIIAPFPLAHPHTSVWLSVLFLILFSHTFSAVFHPLLFLQPISTDWWIPNISHWFTSLRLHSPLFSSSKRSIYLEIHQCISKYTHPLLFFSLSILSQLKMKLSLKNIYIYIYIYIYLFLAIQSGMWDLSSPNHTPCIESVGALSPPVHLHVQHLSICPTLLNCCNHLLKLLQIFSFG